MSVTRIKCEHCGFLLVYCECNKDEYPTQEEYAEWEEEFKDLKAMRPNLDD